MGNQSLSVLLGCSLWGASLALAGCGTTSSSSPISGDAGVSVLDEVNLPRAPASGISADALGAAVAANNGFAVDLFARARVDADAGSSNFLTSPITASLALTMAYVGAKGATATEMATALHIDADAGASIFDGQNALSQALGGRGASALSLATAYASPSAQPAPSAADYELQVVNSVWGDERYVWATPFLNVLAESYGTGVYSVDFKGHADRARQAINAWVAGETSDKIDDLLPQSAIDGATRMVLVDALHLKFPWATAFDTFSTTMAPFTRSDGTTEAVPFMHRTDTLSYADDGKAQVVSLPLWGGELSIVIALPHTDISLADYEAALGAGSAALSPPRSSALVALSVPKVAFTSPTFSLKAALQAMGMVQAFEANADFSGLYTKGPDGPLFVVDVLQKATIAMQESGIESTAATAVILEADGAAEALDAAPPQPVPMAVDHPYLIAIVDGPTGAVLALGQVGDPSDPGSP